VSELPDPGPRMRAVEVRASVEPPAWASKGGEEPNWRRAALTLARDILALTSSGASDE
jgi:hypothetical protein